MIGISNTRFKIGSRLKGLPHDIAWRFGINDSFYKNARGARILVYHGVCKDDHLRFNTLFVKLRTFESQLRLYKKYFNLISLDDFYQQRFSDQRFNICLSFDDGFANNHKYVLPLLAQYQVPAAFFVTGIREADYDILWNDLLSIAYHYGPAKIVFAGEEFVKGKGRPYQSLATGSLLAGQLRSVSFEERAVLLNLLNKFRHNADADYWLQMTVEQIRALSHSKWVTIGSHSSYHNDLSQVDIRSAKEDLCQSKKFLENVTDKEVKALAFPYGSYTREIVGEAKTAGYSQLLATEFKNPQDGLDETMRERLTVNPFISDINQLHANIKGHY